MNEKFTLEKEIALNIYDLNYLALTCVDLSIQFTP